ncbi:TonB-dependent receptor domain-containing protein [Chitinophaga sp. LS1]|uniref:TonB-dependent receptor domain-containing protein n=1 Tax=Chitinophaga sp. LS1 TaxID=3051176 RepID=UPI002AAC4301|nr:TonB-dependent receptor [Chitinophaga sp. LS1]WPV67964.1 TonB-dependent receptor [Chitinophaga sp. LS1]
MYKLIMLIGFLLCYVNILSAQKHTSITVSGVCDQCQQRIETAAKGNGVNMAHWDVATKTLHLEYDTTQTNLNTIEERILKVGHDVDSRKASAKAYNALPGCCQYRKATTEHEVTTPVTGSQQSTTPLSTAHQAKIPVSGACEQCQQRIETAAKGNGVSMVHWEVATKTLQLEYDPSQTNLNAVEERILKVGHDVDNRKASAKSYNALPECCHYRVNEQQLKEFTVNSRVKTTQISSLATARTEIVTSKELLKAACCNLSESFETNPSVDVSYNDAITGSKQIQLLGLSGNYTQLTVENLPGPRGLATPLGLNSIAGPWVESIQLTKGIGSVANGYESIAGQINVELKKPESNEQLYANVYVNDFGKTDVNVNLAQKINSKWSVGLLLHDDFLVNKKVDFTRDGFRDVPTGNLFSAVNRWKYDNGKGFMTIFGVKVLKDEKKGGQIDYKSGSSLYGLGINTDRYEAFAKIGYTFPAKPYKSVGLQLAGISHTQNSFFGLTKYDGDQKSVYANLIYQSIIGSTTHKFRTGFSFLNDDYNESYNALKYKRTEVVPGAFFEYTFAPVEKFSVVAGLRGDNNSLFGFFLTPRIHVRYEPIPGTTVRVSAGRGQRTANILAENMSVMASARTLQILGATDGKAYGLNPEVAWNKGMSIDQKLTLFGRDAMVSVDYFRNDFNNQVVVDVENPTAVKFYNLDGKSYSNSMQAEITAEPLPKLDVRVAYRYFDVKTTYSGTLKQRPLTAKHRVFANLAYGVKTWKFDYTVNYNGPKRIPMTAVSPEAYSQRYVTMNAQASKTFAKKLDIYVGAENLTNFYQKDPVINAGQPFSAGFDASMVWGPVIGRMFYGGLRYKI